MESSTILLIFLISLNLQSLKSVKVVFTFARQIKYLRPDIVGELLGLISVFIEQSSAFERSVSPRQAVINAQRNSALNVYKTQMCKRNARF